LIGIHLKHISQTFPGILHRN